MQGNEVLYPDAFTDGVRADVALTYRVGSLECDVILRAQLPSPALYSLNPDTCRLQVWHELLGDVPAPTVKDHLVHLLNRADVTLREASLLQPGEQHPMRVLKDGKSTVRQ